MKRSFFKTTILCSTLLYLMGCFGDDSSSTKTKVDEYPVLGCTEIMFNSTDSLEFVEFKILKGPGIVDMALANLRIEGAVKFTFPNEALDTNEYIVLTNDPTLFRQNYPDFTGRLFGPWDLDEDGELPKLPNEGDNVEIKLTGKGDVSCSFSGEPPWPSLADGKGRTLVFLGGDHNPAYSESWAAHTQDGGNPGGPDTYIPTLKIRINEVMPSLGGNPSWVELYNSGSESIDISGWEFRVSAKDTTFILPEGTIVGANDYLVLSGAEVEGAFGAEGLYVNTLGSNYYLREMVDGVRTGAETSLKAPAGEYSSGFIVLADGSLAQGNLSTATPGTANDILLAGPIFINEIHYHPEDYSGEIEFLELINKSDEAISFNPIINTKAGNWAIDGVKMAFVSPSSIPANGLVVLIESTNDSALFRQTNNISADVPIYYYDGKLSNRGELLVLKKPIAFTTTSSATAPSVVEWLYAHIDAVLYSDDWTDMEETDGFGKSLHRQDYTSMGYEMSAWKADLPTPGVK